MSSLVSELNGKHKFILDDSLEGKDNKAFDSGGRYDKNDAFDLSYKPQSKFELSLYTTNKPEQNVNSKNKENRLPPVPFYQLFRFATCGELTSSIFGIFLASIAAVFIPISVILYGEFTALLVDRAIRTGTSSDVFFLQLFGGGKILTNATIEENRAALLDDAKAFGILSIIVSVIQFFIGAASIDIINYSAIKQISRIRQLFLQSVLRQDVSWFDTNTDNNFAVRITDDLDKLREGIGEKLAIFIYLLMTFVVSVIISFFYGWKLTLVILSCAPLIILATAFVAKIQSSLTEKELQSYSSAGTVAEEVLTSIRTVIAFGGQQKEVDRYKDKLRSAEISGQKKGLFSGIGGGAMWFIIYCCYALAFWYGVGLILEDREKPIKEYTPAVLVIVLFGVLAGAQNLGLSSPHLEAFATARGSAAAIFSVIDRQPIIDSLGTTGLRPTINGNIEFNKIYFRYPARRDVQVLNGLNLSIKQGQTVALVGPSGCGKSTCLQLLQRLYDPLSGSLKIDDVDIKEFNTAWLRSFIGVVGQEPVLFATTIGENIRYGKPDATDYEIEMAAKIANCHDFISKLPNGYETMVGERGSQLSGGQKQRIAIARAIVRNPKILILDEATSALDPHSERIVQDALERASKGRTTLVVSHRLSTITNADNIVYIENGVVCEMGTHDELMQKEGLYYDLVNASNSKTSTPAEKSTVFTKNKKNASTRKVEMKKASIGSLGKTTEETDGNDEEVDDEDDDEEDEVQSEEAKEEPEDEKHCKLEWKRIFKMNAKEWPYILAGCIAALVVGSSFPVFAILFGEVYGALSITDPDIVKEKSNIFAILFIALGFCTGLGTFMQTFMFNISGVRLTSRLRIDVFTAMIRQEMAWFDDVKNSLGALCVRLSGDCASVQGATGSRIGSIIQAISTIAIGIIISFFFSWNLTLVSLLGVPIVLFAVYFESRYMETSQVEEKQAMESTTKIAIEAISNIRTVASLCQEKYVIERYVQESTKVQKACRQKIRLRGVVFSLGQAAPLLGYAISLFYGGLLVYKEEIEYKTVIKVSEALIFGSWMLGQALAYAPNVDSAIISAARLLKIIDRSPKIQDPVIISDESKKEVEGELAYKDTEFYYPTRPNIPVLQKLNLNIKQGQTIALVGPSGCGKSTCIQLLLRYYDPILGQVNVDGTPTTDFQVKKLRSHMGIVSQEPVLFDRTIADNIAYGDNSRTVSMDEIIKAAQMSNIHKFVTSLPLGYDTPLGAKGAQLSGGQKQRIAIARALIRNPKILLLDEATSALDTQSEKTVQEALDLARTGRTCITIAHRLTTVRNSDVICVIEGGQIAEIGTHDELLNLGKIYAKHYTMQQIG